MCGASRSDITSPPARRCMAGSPRSRWKTYRCLRSTRPACFIGFDEESQAVIACKDRFEFDADAETWTLEITAQQANGSWAHFAKYLFRRAT